MSRMINISGRVEKKSPENVFDGLDECPISEREHFINRVVFSLIPDNDERNKVFYEMARQTFEGVLKHIFTSMPGYLWNNGTVYFLLNKTPNELGKLIKNTAPLAADYLSRDNITLQSVLAILSSVKSEFEYDPVNPALYQ
ncbi:MAG: hypothetical protein HPY53_01115 [Brevinematales bacterium]|nr:hypothetical protein [Brevinematales bacterium]